MKIVLIADTHGFHNKLVLPDGDMIIHAGDVSMSGKGNQVLDFLNWFEWLPYKYKIFIAGNHDFYFERTDSKVIESIIPRGVTYLNDSGVTIEGIKIWGSPIQPWFYDWAFNRERGNKICKHWDLIPNDTDILITHGPRFPILDLTDSGIHVGCEDLSEYIGKIKPKLHVCGHIHEGYGKHADHQTMYVNASVVDLQYRLVNEPIVVDYYI